MRQRLALIGSQDFAQQIIDYAKKTNLFDIVGYYDDFQEKGNYINGLPILGKVNDIINDYINGLFDCTFICMGYNHFRIKEEFYNKVKGIIPLATIIVPGADIADSAIIGEGVLITKETIIHEHCIIEDNVVILGGLLAHDNHIGKHTYIAGGVHFAGKVSIGKRCFIGIRTLVADHVSICDDVWITLGCIVAENITKSGKYLSPAQRIICFPQ